MAELSLEPESPPDLPRPRPRPRPELSLSVSTSGSISSSASSRSARSRSAAARRLRVAGLERNAVLHRAGAAALAFTESVTLVAGDHVPSEAYDAVAAHFTPDEVAALVCLIVTINAWNGIAVTTRAWVPGSYGE